MATNKSESDTIEECVIGTVVQAAMLDTTDEAQRVMTLYLNAGMTEAWFANPHAKKVFASMVRLYRETHRIDVYLIGEACGETDYAMTCGERVTTSANADEYCETLRRTYVHRTFASEMVRLVQRSSPDTIADALSQAEALRRKLAEVSAHGGSVNGFVSMSSYREQMERDFRLLSRERYVKGNRDFYIGLPMPWSFLNDIYHGLRTGLHVIAALPSQGKTAMGNAISLYLREKHIKHGFVCLDMPGRNVAERYASLRGQVSLSRMYEGASPAEVDRFMAAFDRCAEGEYLQFTECGQLDNLSDHIYRAVTDNGLKTVIIDYLQLVEGDSRRNTRQFEVVREATTRLHGISKKLDIPIIALVQLKQLFAKENRDSDRPPAIDDLGDSSAIGRAASTVAVLCKDNKVAKFWEDNPPYDLGYADFNHKYAGDNPFGDKCAVIAKTIRPVWYYVIKNQQGKVGKVPMLMYPSYFMFRPGDPDAAKILDNDAPAPNLNFFTTIRDDWMHVFGDEVLEATGVIGHRGVKREFEGRQQRESESANQPPPSPKDGFVIGDIISDQPPQQESTPVHLPPEEEVVNDFSVLESEGTFMPF